MTALLPALQALIDEDPVLVLELMSDSLRRKRFLDEAAQALIFASDLQRVGLSPISTADPVRSTPTRKAE